MTTPYDFKLLPEALRAGAFAGIVFVLQLAVGLDWDSVESWELWARSAGSGLAAAAAAAMLSVLTRRRAGGKDDGAGAS